MTVRLSPSIKMNGKIILDRFIPEINLSNNQVAENASVGTVVGTASVLNAGSSTFTYELVDEDSTGDFSMTAGGVISVASALNHEERALYPVQIKSIDSRGHRYAIATNILVGDINEPPVDIILSNNEINIAVETSGVQIGTATAVDPDVGDSVSAWSLISNSSGQFTINSTGDIEIVSPVRTGDHTIEIQAEDTGGLLYSEQFNIRLSAKTTQMLSPNTNGTGNRYGNTVVMNRDEDTLAIAATKRTVSGFAESGSVFVYTKSGSSWVLQDRIDDPDLRTDASTFGSNMDISDDGDTLLIAAVSEDVSGNVNQGAAYVFTRSGSSWSLEQKLTGSDSNQSDNYASGVALSGDGDRAVVGAPNWDINPSNNGTNEGKVYVYTRSGSTWTQVQNMTQPGGMLEDNRFGMTVALSKDASYLVVATEVLSTAVQDQTTSYIFTWNGSSYVLQQEIDPNLKDDSSYALNSLISDDGDRAVLAGSNVNNGTGRVYVWDRSGTSWSLTQEIDPFDGAVDDRFGFGMAMSKDKSKLYIGSLFADDPVSDNGAVYVYVWDGTQYQPETKILPSKNQSGQRFGISIAGGYVTDEIVVGAHFWNEGADTNAGAVYVIDLT